MKDPKNERNAGRPQLPPKRKKKRYDVFLVEDDYNALVAKFGSKTPLTLACRAHLISEPTEKQSLEALKKVQDIVNKALG
jgi:hypothetical protein